MGSTLGLGCVSCPYRDDCGGIVSDYDCLAYCCNDATNCEIACPRSHRLGSIVEDSGGWNRKISTLKQDNSICTLPLYVPCVQNGSQRINALDLPIAAIPTFAVTRRTARKRFQSGADFRKHFGIANTTSVVLLSVKDDPALEAYWRYSELRDLPHYLATLDIAYITAPNFSFANNAPRTEHLVNRARSLKCIEEFSKAGINVIPHLNACSEHQWDFWINFLIDHQEITVVSKEFQTGAAIPRVAQWHLQQLERVQQKIGRGLHLVAVGGRRHIQLFLRLSAVTIIDSDPFFKAHFRRALSRPNGNWKIRRADPGEELESLMTHNIQTYITGIEVKFAECRQYSFALEPRVGITPVTSITPNASILSPDLTKQMALWPMRETNPSIAHSTPVE
jgi:hypothetical protein